MHLRAVTLACALVSTSCGPGFGGVAGEERNATFFTGSICTWLFGPCDPLRDVMIGGTTRVQAMVDGCEPPEADVVDPSAPLASIRVTGGVFRVAGMQSMGACSVTAEIEALALGAGSVQLLHGGEQIDSLTMWVREPTTMTLTRASSWPNDPLEERTVVVQAGTTVGLDAIVRDAGGKPLLGDRVRWRATDDAVVFLDHDDVLSLAAGDGVSSPLGEIDAEHATVLARSAGSTIVEASAGAASAEIGIRALSPEEWIASGRCAARPERCNGADDDCDGRVDEGDAARCGITADEVACEAGRCEIVACGSDRADCDGRGSTGCEAALLTSPLHCGGCGIACGASEACVGGTCTRVELGGP